MIVRDEYTFKCFSSGLDDFIVLGNIKQRIHKEAFVARFNVVAIDGQTSSEELLNIETRAFIVGFYGILMLKKSLS